MKKLFVFIVFIITQGVAYTQVPDTLHINYRLREYLFDPGSFWVYENLNTGEVDSIVETGVSKGYMLAINHYYEYFKVDYQSMTLNYSTWDQYIGDVIVREGIGETGQYIFIDSFTIGDSTSGAEIIATYDTLSFGIYHFTNVTKMYMPHNNVENNSPSFYYFAKESGLIRKEILDADTSQVIEVWMIRNLTVYRTINETKEDKKVLPLRVYPNPTNGFINIAMCDLSHPQEVRIFDVLGNLVYSSTLTEQLAQIDMSEFPNGIYIIKFQGGQTRILKY